MQELEKILEEIDAHAIEFEIFGTSDDYISVGWAKDIIRKHMNDGWILVDKNNIPEAEILACDGYKNELIGYLRYNPDGEEFICESDECIMHQVTAWMPRPEPYKPERSNKE